MNNTVCDSPFEVTVAKLRGIRDGRLRTPANFAGYPGRGELHSPSRRSQTGPNDQVAGDRDAHCGETVQGLHGCFAHCDETVQGLHGRFVRCGDAVQVLHTHFTYCDGSRKACEVWLGTCRGEAGGPRPRKCPNRLFEGFRGLGLDETGCLKVSEVSDWMKQVV